MPKYTVLPLLSMLFILLLAPGCSSPRQQQSAGPPQKIQVDAALAQRVVDTAKTVPGVHDATAVVVNRGILVGVSVTGFDRLRIKPIKNEVRTKVRQLNQAYSVQVTADKKLFVELRETAAQIGAGAFTPARIQQEVGKIRRDMQS